LNRKKLEYLVLTVFCATLIVPGHARAQASVEWSVKRQINLEAAALDIVTSADGKWMYILTRGLLLVYSVPNEKVASRIPIDKIFDRVTHSATDNTLIVSSSTEKTLKVIQLEFVQQFALEGLPFKGPKNAPVTLVVFSDYQ
jgi:hypothetical protein